MPPKKASIIREMIIEKNYSPVGSLLEQMSIAILLSGREKRECKDAKGNLFILIYNNLSSGIYTRH